MVRVHAPWVSWYVIVGSACRQNESCQHGRRDRLCVLNFARSIFPNPEAEFLDVMETKLF
jgi:hypothetical protein